MSLKEKIIMDLRNAIIKREYKPGQRLIEADLCSRFKVSRTPIREALNQLEKEGFIKIIHDIGAKVVELSLKDVTDIFDILISLGGTATRLASLNIHDDQISKLEEYNFLFEKNIDKENLDLLFQLNLNFHLLITQASQNSYLVEIWSNFRRLVDHISRIFPLIPGQCQKTLKEHQEITNALKLRNTALSEFLMREHIEMSKKSILSYLQEKGEGY